MALDERTTPEIVASALASIPADFDRDEWARIGMAIKSEFPSDEGFDLFDTWSQTSDRYDPKGVRDTWRSVSEGGGVNIGTVFYVAKQHGWTHPKTGQQPAKPDPVLLAQRQLERLQSTAKEDAGKAQRQQQAATEAAAIWAAAAPATEHPYSTRKQVKPTGLRTIDAAKARAISASLSPDLTGLLLVIPMRNGAGELRNLQFITADGTKRPVTGGAVKGMYHAIGRPTAGEICEAEGWATAASIHAATGLPVACAFNAGNLLPVALALHSKYPAMRLTVCADDDHTKAGNTGLTAATEAARAVGGYLAIPDFGPDRPDGAKDFNDLACISDAAAVKRCIDSAKPVRSPAADGVVLVCGADLTPEPVIWLWLHWLAKGKLHLLAGAPGQGKTTIALACAATVTIGGRWPDGTRSEVGNVLIWSGEDDPADTLLPRLIAAGADRSKVHFVTGTRVDGELTTFDPARDMAGLQHQAGRIGGVALIVVDPIVSVVTGDSHKNTETRRALQPLVDLSAAMGAALLGITHLSKGGQGGDPAQRVIGSVAFVAVARVVLVAAKVKGEDGQDKRILARGKSNIGPDDGGFEYHIEQIEALPGISASYVAWGEAVAGTAKELLTDPNEPQDEQDKSRLDEAQDFLRQALSEGPTPTATVKKEATEAGISWKTIRGAADALHVLKKKGGMTDGWYWSLPKVPNKPPKSAEEALSQTLGNFGTLREEMGTFGENPNPDPEPEIPPKPTKNDAGKWEIPPGDVTDVEVL